MFLRKLPSGKWQATVRCPDGTRRTRAEETRLAARQWAADVEAQLALAGREGTAATGGRTA